MKLLNMNYQFEIKKLPRTCRQAGRFANVFEILPRSLGVEFSIYLMVWRTVVRHTIK